MVQVYFPYPTVLFYDLFVQYGSKHRDTYCIYCRQYVIRLNISLLYFCFFVTHDQNRVLLITGMVICFYYTTKEKGFK